jgi:hypothetical protein
MNEVPAEQLTFEWFSALLRTKFRVHADPSGVLELELVEAAAAPLKARGPGPTAAARLEGFSLMFTGPGDRLLPQGTYRFEHDQKGRFDLFMVPVGRGPDTIQYQVIFNRLILGVQPPG